MNKNGCYIDLHAHLDGSVTVDIAKKLAALQNIALPADNDEEASDFAFGAGFL